MLVATTLRCCKRPPTSCAIALFHRRPWFWSYGSNYHHCCSLPIMEKLSIDVGSPSPAIAAPGRRPIPPLCCFECQRQDLRGNFALETLSIVARQVLTLTLNAMKHDKASISVFSLPLYAMVWTQPNRTRTRKNAVHFVCTPRTTCDTSKLVSSPLGGALIVRIIYSGIHSWEKQQTPPLHRLHTF